MGVPSQSRHTSVATPEMRTEQELWSLSGQSRAMAEVSAQTPELRSRGESRTIRESDIRRRGAAAGRASPSPRCFTFTPNVVLRRLVRRRRAGFVYRPFERVAIFIAQSFQIGRIDGLVVLRQCIPTLSTRVNDACRTPQPQAPSGIWGDLSAAAAQYTRSMNRTVIRGATILTLDPALDDIAQATSSSRARPSPRLLLNATIECHAHLAICQSGNLQPARKRR
jgi:hypothetical protein